MTLRKATLVACALLAASIVPTASQAQLFRAYLSGERGSDANPCTLQLPCRLLPAALAAVASLGEIWMLDSANYNTGQVEITTSVSILAIPGVVGSVVATGGAHAIRVNGSFIKVTLRNLVITRLNSGVTGISFVQGSELNVSDCEIANVSDGIVASAPGSNVHVKSTVFRGMVSSGLTASGSVTASLDGVHISGTNTAVSGFNGSRITISNSVLAGNNVGANAFANGGAVLLAVEGSVLSGNNFGIFADANFSGDVVEVAASRNTISHNATAGIRADEVSGAAVTVVADGNVVTHNGVGFQFVGTGLATINTRGNNTARFNTTDVSGGALTALGGM